MILKSLGVREDARGSWVAGVVYRLYLCSSLTTSPFGPSGFSFSLSRATRSSLKVLIGLMDLFEDVFIGFVMAAVWLDKSIRGRSISALIPRHLRDNQASFCVCL